MTPEESIDALYCLYIEESNPNKKNDLKAQINEHAEQIAKSIWKHHKSQRSFRTKKEIELRRICWDNLFPTLCNCLDIYPSDQVPFSLYLKRAIRNISNTAFSLVNRANGKIHAKTTEDIDEFEIADSPEISAGNNELEIVIEKKLWEIASLLPKHMRNFIDYHLEEKSAKQVGLENRVSRQVIDKRIAKIEEALQPLRDTYIIDANEDEKKQFAYAFDKALRKVAAQMPAEATLNR